MAKFRVFADTNVLLEASRTGCWAAICDRFAIETVEKCVEEALTGNPGDHGKVPIDGPILRSGLTRCHQVGQREIAGLVLAEPFCQGLDDGELHLLALLKGQGFEPEAKILISTADKAAIRASHRLGWLDAVVSLEELARESGIPQARLDLLAGHYRRGWLAALKTAIRLDAIGR